MSGALQTRAVQNSYLLLATKCLRRTQVESVHMHAHTNTETYAAVVCTDTLSCGSFDMSSIHLASCGDETWGCSLCHGCQQLRKGVISLILVAGERTTQREIERMTFSVNKKYTATWLTQMWTQASRRLPPSSGRGNLLTLWCNGEILGASECYSGYSRG